MFERKHLVLLIVFFAVLICSALNNEDYFTWLLEVAPGVIGVAILALTFKRFRFSYMTYVLILLQCIVLFVGAKYTYAKMPLFEWITAYFSLARNNYDKVGHFIQGFVPAAITRELIVRLKIVSKRGWMNFFVVCICLAVSAFYELIEWWAAALTGDSAEAFLGTQGYVWDTQSDMLMALIGASLFIILLSKVQDKAIAKERGA